ncbi:hypothetical protein [Streptomyces reniochalinae]|uniref:hypothetical protein n=1 Tax=Streptomyces reniochalinae TaxID=2250578 RepID=UPI0011C05CC4|nr:hypothetical protein [Streptomyces reniochalinae]
MELVLKRNDWGSLRGATGTAAGLDLAVRALSAANDRDAATSAAQQVQRYVFANGFLCEAAAPLATALVHCLWRSTEHNEDLILGILSDISAATVDEEDPGVYGPASETAMLNEVSLGYPAYVEILETGTKRESRTACIDLVLMCGLACAHLHSRSIYYLEKALEMDAFQDHRDVIRSSLADLRESS